MEIISLTPDEIQILEARHTNCRDKRECDRIKAVLLYNEGWNLKLIAQALRKLEDTIKRTLMTTANTRN